MRLKTYKMAMAILPKFLTLKWNISRTTGRIEVGDGSSFCIFHALSFELSFVFDRRFPLNTRREKCVEVDNNKLPKFSLRHQKVFHKFPYISRFSLTSITNNVPFPGLQGFMVSQKPYHSPASTLLAWIRHLPQIVTKLSIRQTVSLMHSHCG